MRGKNFDSVVWALERGASINERIKYVSLTYYETTAAMAYALDVTAATISNVTTGRLTPTYNFIYSLITKTPNLNPIWLLLGIPPHENDVRYAEAPSKDINKRIKQLIESAYPSSVAFSEALQVKPHVIYNIIGGTLNKPNIEMIIKIINLNPTLYIEWLLTGRGPMYQSQAPTPVTQQPIPQKTVSQTAPAPITPAPEHNTTAYFNHVIAELIASQQASTVAQIAYQSKIPLQHLTQIVNAQTTPTQNQIAQLTQAYPQVNAQYLLKGQRPPLLPAPNPNQLPNAHPQEQTLQQPDTEAISRNSISTRFLEALNKIIDLRLSKNYTEIAETLGITKATITNIKAGKQDATAATIAQLLAYYPYFSAQYLLTGQGELFTTEGKKISTSNINLIYQAESILLPYYGDMTAAASYGYIGNPVTQPMEYTPVYIDPNSIEAKKGHVIKVSGDSMEPTIPDGATVLVLPQDPSNWQFINNSVVIISYNHEIVIKRISGNYLATRGYLTLSSDNPRYGTIDVTAEQITAISKVTRIVNSPVK